MIHDILIKLVPSLKAEIDALRADNDHLAEKNAELDHNLRHAEITARTYKDKHAASEKRATALLEEKQSLIADAEKARQTYNALEARLKATQQTNKDLKTQIAARSMAEGKTEEVLRKEFPTEYKKAAANVAKSMHGKKEKK